MFRFTTLVVLFLAGISSHAQNLRTSVKSGNWSNKNTWDCTCVPSATDHATIATGHIVTFLSTNAIINLTIESGAILTDNGLSNTIAGNFVVHGTYSGSGVIRVTGINTTIDGSGTISNSATIEITGNKTILTSASLTINTSAMALQGAYTITNQGSITVGGNITGTDAGSTWVNHSNSTLNIGGSSGVPLLAMGTLHAFASGNTVNYYAGYAHTLKLPSTVSGYSTYHHLKISGSNTKTLPNGDVAVNGDLTINSTFSGSGSSKKLFLRGNWINNGNFTEGTGLGTVTFDGTTDQSITRAATENLNVVVVNKTSGKVIVNTSLVAERGLTMMAGDIDMKSNKLTLGLSTSIVGTFSWTSGTIIGKFERWISSAGVPVLFPIGSASHYRPASILFNSLTPGSLIAEFITASPGKNGLPLTESSVTLYNTFRDGYWALTPANSLDTLNFNLDLTGNGFNGFTINDNTRLVTRTSSVNPWGLQGSHLIRVSNTVRRTNMTTLSGQYCFGDDTNCTAPNTSVITGLTDVCTNTIGSVYSVTNNIPNTYTWDVIGGSISSGNNTNSIVVDWGPSGIVGRVSVVEKNTCTEGEEVRLSVNVHALPIIAITGKVNVPENGITAETYSVPAQASYTYTWLVTGGAITSGQGTNSITVNWASSGAGSVCVTGTHAPTLPDVSCGQSINTCSTINIYKVINSIRSGNWQTAVNWDCSCVPASVDNVTIKNTHAISLNSARTINHVNINPGGSINTNSNTFTITGDLAVNGTLSGTGTVVLSGTNTTVDGIGVITNTGAMNITGTKTILATAALTKNSGMVTINAGVVVTNSGTIMLGDALVGIDNNSQWINATNSTLNIAGDLLTTGKLYASASGNTIRFYGSTGQAIPTPNSGQYANIMISGTGIKTAPGGVMYVSGNFINDGNVQHNNGTVEFNGNSQVSGSAVTTFHHVSLSSGSSLTFPSAMVNVRGNITFAAGSLFDSSTGTVVLNGTGNQNIDVRGANFYTLRINKTGGTVNVNSVLSILHLLDFQSTTTFNTNGQLIIKSLGNTTSLDGGIGALPSNNLIVGQVTVERYMNPIGRTFRYVTSPVSNALVPLELGSSIYEYVYASGVGNWVRHVMTNLLERSKGYSVLVPNGSNPITWSVSGLIQQGEFTWNFNEEGWHLIGNPFPSAIRWFDDAQGWRLTNVASTIAVTDNAVSGYPNYFRYWSYDDADNPTSWGAGELQNGVVAMAQAFWVYAGAGGGSLTIKEPAKSVDGNGRFYRKQSESKAEKLLITLANGNSADRAYVKLHPSASSEFELRYDAMKLWNKEVNVYLIDDEKNELGIYAVDEISEDKIIPIGVQVNEPGEYTISMNRSENFGDGTDLYLVDKLEKHTMPVGTNFSYSFFISDHSKPWNERFYLTRRREVLIPDTNPLVQVYPNPVKDVLQIHLPKSSTSTLSLFNSLGNVCWTGTGSSLFNIDMSHFEPGFYMLRVELGGEVETFKVVKY